MLICALHFIAGMLFGNENMRIGILALQGNVIEHRKALEEAAKNLRMETEIVMVRGKNDLKNLDAIILPGGESTTIYLLLEKFGMLAGLRKIKFIFGTCAGLILMAKKVEGLAEGQKTLGLMDISIGRNAYGSQINSFLAWLDICQYRKDKGDWGENGKDGENKPYLEDELGILKKMGEVMFIRAPKIKSIGKGVKVLAKVKDSGELAIVEQKKGGQYLLGAVCHPEMTTSKLEEYFLHKIS